MSMRTIARSSSKRKSASALASSVLPTPVGPRNRNDPVGRSGSAMPGAARRTASETARDRVFWPIRRAPRSSSMRSSFSVSPSSSRPAGMPVQALIDVGDVVGADLLLDHRRLAAGRGLVASAALGLAQLALQRRDLAVEQLGRAGEVALALQPLGLHAQLVELLLEVADPVEPGLLLLPARGQRGQLLACGRPGPCAGARAAPWRPGRSRARARAPPSSAGRRRGAARRSRPGEESISMRSREAASSIRSIALSGSWRPLM